MTSEYLRVIAGDIEWRYTAAQRRAHEEYNGMRLRRRHLRTLGVIATYSDLDEPKSLIGISEQIGMNITETAKNIHFLLEPLHLIVPANGAESLINIGDAQQTYSPTYLGILIAPEMNIVDEIEAARRDGSI